MYYLEWNIFYFNILRMYFCIINFLSSYCDQLKISESTHVLQPFLPSILDGLIHLATQFSSEVLNLVMETLCIVCTVDPAFTASMENKICPFTIAIFLKYSNGVYSTYIPKAQLVLLLNPAAENLINGHWTNIDSSGKGRGETCCFAQPKNWDVCVF